MGIKASIQPHKHQYIVYVGPKSYLNFIDMIKPYCVWDCYAYKHDLTNYKEQEWACGENHYKSKLTTDKINEIIYLWKNGQTQKEISTKFSLNQCTVSRLVNRKRWKHLGVSYAKYTSNSDSSV